MSRAVIGLIACAVLLPAAAFVGVAVSRPAVSNRAEWLRVADVSELPSDGRPRRYEVAVLGSDAWTTGASKPIGAVFVRRDPENGSVSALYAVHCHASIPVRAEYDAAANCYRSCCWKVRFDLEGHEIPEDDGPPMGDRIPPVPVRVDNGQVFVQMKSTPCGSAEQRDAADSR
jgi:nitrite reductase/ring-hydroxylating ferredoxin subunit